MELNRKLQLVETNILLDVDKICHDNDLTYYMIGGTLLGAVRHKGFIPWDDDIDIVMYRNDYNRFIQIVQQQYKEKYFVQTFDTDKSYTRYIVKLRLIGTELVEACVQQSNAYTGVYVDIFPLDHVRKKGGIDLALRGRVVRWLFAYKTVRYDSQSRTKGTLYYLGRIFRFTTFLVPRTWTNKLFDYVCTKDNKKNCRYTTNFASHFKWKKQLFENEVFGEGCKLEFEGHMLNAPVGYTTILERLYGKNYMALPSKEKQITHKIVKLDLGQYDSTLVFPENGNGGYYPLNSKKNYAAFTTGINRPERRAA